MPVLNVYRVNKSYASFRPPKDTVVVDVSEYMDINSLHEGDFINVYRHRVSDKKHVLLVIGGSDESGRVERMFLLTTADIEDPRMYGMSKHRILPLRFSPRQTKKSLVKKSRAKKSKTKKSLAKKSKTKKSKAKKSLAKRRE